MESRPLKIFQSSAGSGKTFTLVKEYLFICLPQPSRFANVAALTFTNAAAAEMKERIILKLTGLANGTEDMLAEALVNDGLNPEYLQNANLLLENILFNYSRFCVTTIDSFFTRIIRAFSAELNISYDFEIFLESEKAIEDSVDQFVRHAGSNQEVFNLLSKFIEENIIEGRSWQISDHLKKIASEILKDGVLNQPSRKSFDALNSFIHQLKELRNTFERRMNEIGSKVISELQKRGLSIQDFKYKSAGAAGYFIKIQSDNKIFDPGQRFLDCLNDASNWTNKNDSNIILAAAEEILAPNAVEAYNLFVEKGSDYFTANEILKCIYTFGVFEEINQELQDYRAKNNIILASDFTRILSDHLKNEEVSFIYSRIGAWYNHFLIDEFQDTSKDQWECLKPLIENAVSQGSTCIVVGDAKQAIYRWRGGALELIEKDLETIDFPNHSSKFSLSSNYRSTKQVIDFNNRFFHNMDRLFESESADLNLLKTVFDKARQDIPKDAPGEGYVEVEFCENTKEYKNWATEKLLRAVNSAVQDNFDYFEICILVRTAREASAVAGVLHQKQIPFLSAETLFADHSPTVRLLLSLIKSVISPGNILALTEAKYLYSQYLLDSKVDFSDIINSNGTGLPTDFFSGLTRLRSLPLFDLVENLIRIFNLSHESDAYIQRFEEAVLEYSQTFNSSPSGFLQWWQDSEFSVVLPERGSGVRIMTIHKSKGLEFPVVIIPFADWNYSNFSDPKILWVSPDRKPFNSFEKLPVRMTSALEKTYFKKEYDSENVLTIIDNLNLLYVAMTRAVNQLYIYTKLSPAKNSIGSIIKGVLQPADNNLKITSGFHSSNLKNSNLYAENTFPELPINNLGNKSSNSKDRDAYRWIYKILRKGNTLEEISATANLLFSDDPSTADKISELLNTAYFKGFSHGKRISPKKIIIPGFGVISALHGYESDDSLNILTQREPIEVLKQYSDSYRQLKNKPVILWSFDDSYSLKIIN